MQMLLRWFGGASDTVTLAQIRQIPGICGVVPALHDIPAGEIWPLARLRALKAEIAAAGLTMECVESINVHEDIKLGTPRAAQWIENYKVSLRHCAAVGVKVVCYNFMPVFDWTRTDMAMPLPDGSTALAYDGRQVEGLDAEEVFRTLSAAENGFALPGWEPNRLPQIKASFAAYKNVTEEDIWRNLSVFLNEVIPVCEELGIKLAVHPDDPPWSVFGLPRILKNMDDFRRLFTLCPSRANGVTFCSGSLGVFPGNNLPGMIAEMGDRIYFAHLRNVAVGDRRFHETAHLSRAGSLDMAALVLALCKSGFDGYVRPDHGRMIWGEFARPGYGLYDRALGAAYLQGLFEMAGKQSA